MAIPSLNRSTASVLLTVAAAVLTCLSVGQAAEPAGGAAAVSRLVSIRAAHHPGFDRVVFEFSGAAPTQTHVRYVRRLIADPSGRPIPVAGRAILEASFFATTARREAGSTAAPDRIAFAVPNVMTAVRAGDFESVVSYGVGLAKRTSFHVSMLSRPSRVVIDVGTPFRTVLRRVYFQNQPRFRAGTPPYASGVARPVPAGTPASGVMDRLFAGPTPAESASGLRLQRSGTDGFTGLSIAGQIARVRLTGRCSSGGSTFTVADEISPTLKQFATVDFVKISDQAGHTETPGGRSDSIPFCLEP